MASDKIAIVTSPRCSSYRTIGHPEKPARVIRSIEYLRDRPHLEWIEARPATLEEVERVHPHSHCMRLQSGDFFEADTPAYPDIFEYALLSAGGAIQAAQIGATGQKAFSLMRPPGHHCSREQLMGFCYLNNLAIAVEAVRRDPSIQRVAIFDFDCHHGNGTEEIFSKNPNVLFVSIHQSPCYPYTGLESHDNILNYPLTPYTKTSPYLEVCRQAIDVIREFKPDFLAISAGFDAYENDPLTQMSLTIDAFEKIGTLLGELKTPSFAVLEGGYSEELPECIEAFLKGWYAV